MTPAKILCFNLVRDKGLFLGHHERGVKLLKALFNDIYAARLQERPDFFLKFLSFFLRGSFSGGDCLQ